MNDVELFKHQLRALQGNCAAMIQTIQGLLSVIEKEDGSQEGDETSKGKCEHPQRFLHDARTMGHKNRFFCMNCHEYVDLDEGDIKLLTTVA